MLPCTCEGRDGWRSGADEEGDSLKLGLDPLPWIGINKSRQGEGMGHFTGESSKRLLCHIPLTPAGFESSPESPVFTTEHEAYLVVVNAWPLLNIFAAC